MRYLFTLFILLVTPLAAEAFVPDPFNRPPSAFILFSPVIESAPATVSFDGSNSRDDGEIISFSWNFGDGTGGGGQVTSHQYTAPGTYRVALTVQDEMGFSRTTATLVTIPGGPGPGGPGPGGPGPGVEPPIVPTKTLVSCRGAACEIRLTCNLTTPCTNRINIFIRRSTVQSARAGKNVKFASGVADVPPNSTRTVKIRLTRQGKRILRANKGRRLRGTLQISDVVTGSIVNSTRIKLLLTGSATNNSSGKLQSGPFFEVNFETGVDGRPRVAQTVDNLTGNVTDFQYNINNQLSRTVTTGPASAGGQLLSTTTFETGIDGRGRAGRTVDNVTGNVTNFTYDPNNQLAQSQTTGPASEGSQLLSTTTFEIGVDGQARIHQVVNHSTGQVNTYVYDERNQPVRID